MARRPPFFAEWSVMLRVHDQKRYRKIAEEVFAIGQGRHLEVTLREQTGFLTRFAKNEIHQNGFPDTLKISIRIVEGGKSVRVETTDISRAALSGAMDRLDALIRSREGKDGEPSLLSKQSYRRVNDFDPAAARQTPFLAARAVAGAIDEAKARGAEASGYYSAACRHVYIANTKGLEAWHRSSSFRFGLTVRKGPGLGYASCFHVFTDRLGREAALAKALERAECAARPVRIKPGRYTVIFAPRAMSELTAPLFEDMNARKVGDRNSFFWKKKGKRIFSNKLTIEDNVYHPEQTGLPFDGAGLPRKKVLLVDRGVVRNFVNDRKTALDFRVTPTGHGAGALQPSTLPVNIVASAGGEKLSELFKGAGPVIFISHIWYHQVTHPNSLLATGLIKGSALIWQKGAWRGGVQHVRYSESITAALNRIFAVSRDKEMIKDKEYGGSLWPFVGVEGFRIV